MSTIEFDGLDVDPETGEILGERQPDRRKAWVVSQLVDAKEQENAWKSRVEILTQMLLRMDPEAKSHEMPERGVILRRGSWSRKVVDVPDLLKEELTTEERLQLLEAATEIKPDLVPEGLRPLVDRHTKLKRGKDYFTRVTKPKFAPTER